LRKILQALSAIIAACSTVAAIPTAAAESPVDVAIGPVTGIATDAMGDVYFSSSSIVYRLDPAGTLARIAGTGEAGYSGDGGLAAAARLNIPFDNYPELAADFVDFYPLTGPLAVDASGNLYIGDAYNNRVRRVDTNGVISTVLGDGAAGYPLPYSPSGWPQGIAVDGVGNLYVAGAFGQLARMSRDGAVTPLAGPGCGDPFGAGLCVPEQIAVDASGNTYVPDGYCRVRKVSAAGQAVTIAGNVTPGDYNGMAFACGYSGDGGPAIGAALCSQPFGVALDGANNLYIADTGNHCIRRVDPAGVITTFAGVCGRSGYIGDGGTAIAALLNHPFGVTVDATGNVYIADTYNHRIRKVTTDGRIATVAGNGNRDADAIPTVAIPAAAATPLVSSAAVDSFRIRQLYSSQDGDYQFIELEEVAGKSGENQFAGLNLTVVDRHGAMKTFTFPNDLSNASTANKHVLVMSATHAAAGASHDFVMPDRFLPTDGGTLDFAGIDHWTFQAISNGGEIYRDEHPIPSGIAQTFDGRFVGCCWGINSSVREYFDAALDEYFMTSMAPDIDAIESGRLAGWAQGGKLFHAWSIPYGDGDSPMLPPPLPVCRYYIPPASHFYSASPAECESTGQNYPQLVLETSVAFYAYLPDSTTGQCPVVANESTVNTQPVYRLWKSSGNSNHRFTTSLSVRSQMLNQGWIAEGYGPDGVAMCVSGLAP